MTIELDDALPTIPLSEGLDPQKYIMPDGLAGARPAGTEYVCLLCGKTFTGWGCLVRLDEHLSTEHHAIPPGKTLWSCFESPRRVVRKWREHLAEIERRNGDD